MANLSAEVVTAELKRRGFLQSGEVTQIESGKRFNAFADEVCRLHLQYSPTAEPSAPQTLICKSYGTQWFASHGKPELYFYEQIAPQMAAIPIVGCCGVIGNPEALAMTGEPIHLLLEDLDTYYALAAPPISDHQLEIVTDLLVALHARWWQHPLLENAHFTTSDTTVCRMPQALGEAEVRRNVSEAQLATRQFLHRHQDELLPDEAELLLLLAQRWGDCFCMRIAGGRAITLMHGDFHLLGNIFFAKSPAIVPSIKIIDWAQSKRGIGAHDLMYMLLAADSGQRRERDRLLLRRYHAGLLAAGVADYSWQQCLWDYQFSQLTNLFQSVFQDSLRWFRKTFEAVKTWESEALILTS